MNDTPDKGRGATSQGRTTDPDRGNLLQPGSVPGPSHRKTKCVSQSSILPIQGFYLLESSENRWLLPLVTTSRIREILHIYWVRLTPILHILTKYLVTAQEEIVDVIEELVATTTLPSRQAEDIVCGCVPASARAREDVGCSRNGAQRRMPGTATEGSARSDVGLGPSGSRKEAESHV